MADSTFEDTVVASYYYLMASLPSLSPNAKPALDFGTFISMCRGQVSESVLKDLEGLDIANAGKGKSSCALLDKWLEFNANVSCEINAQRAKRLGLDEKFAFDRTLESSFLARKVLSKDNPLEAEKTLIEGQFAFVDGLCALHSFDSWSLFGYALKLKILERSNLFVFEEGKEEFARLLDGILTEIG